MPFYPLLTILATQDLRHQQAMNIVRKSHFNADDDAEFSDDHVGTLIQKSHAAIRKIQWPIRPKKPVQVT